MVSEIEKNKACLRNVHKPRHAEKEAWRIVWNNGGAGGYDRRFFFFLKRPERPVFTYPYVTLGRLCFCSLPFISALLFFSRILLQLLTHFAKKKC